MITLINQHEAKADAIEVNWSLLLERPEYANISHTGKMPTRDDHVRHVLYHTHADWCLIADEHGAYVGSIYITHKSEIGIGILKAHQRKGYGRQAIEAMMQRNPRPYYLANVAPGNHPSHKLFESLQDAVICQLTYRFNRGEEHHGASPSSPEAA